MGQRGLSCVLALAVLVSGGALKAQVERGTIAGTVRDSSGAVVPNVNITVRNVNTGVEFKTTSNASGEYVAPNLIPGEYSLEASAQGFSTLVRSGLRAEGVDPGAALGPSQGRAGSTEKPEPPGERPAVRVRSADF